MRLQHKRYLTKQEHLLLILQLDVARLGPDLGLDAILAATVPPDERQVDQTDAPTDDDGDLGGLVARGVLGAERLGPDDVADAVGDQVQRRDGRLLGVARDVGGDQAEERHERRRRRLRQVVARQPARVVVERQGHDQDHAQDRRRQAAHGDQDALAQPVAEPAAEHERDHFDRAAGRAV